MSGLEHRQRLLPNCLGIFHCLPSTNDRQRVPSSITPRIRETLEAKAARASECALSLLIYSSFSSPKRSVLRPTGQSAEVPGLDVGLEWVRDTSVARAWVPAYHKSFGSGNRHEKNQLEAGRSPPWNQLPRATSVHTRMWKAVLKIKRGQRLFMSSLSSQEFKAFCLKNLHLCHLKKM